MKKVIPICLMFVAFGAAAQQKYKAATVEGYVMGVEEGTEVYMWHLHSNRATVSDSIRDGRFTLKFDLEEPGAQRVQISIYGPNGESTHTEVYAEGGKTTTMRGDGYLIGLWDVEADFPEQAQYNVFRENAKELTRREQELRIDGGMVNHEMFETMKAEGQTVLDITNMTPYQDMMQGRYDSISDLRRALEPAFVASDIEVMKRTEPNEVWLEKYAYMLFDSMDAWLMRWGKADREKVHPDLLALYSRIPASMLEDVDGWGAEVAKQYKLFTFEETIDFSRAAQVDSLPAAEAGKPAPDVEFFDLDGNIHRLSEFRGSYVLLDFWAYWCGPCRAAMPKLRKLAHEYGGKLEVVSICEDPEKVWRKTSADEYITCNFNSGTNEALWVAYGIEYIPHYVLIGPDGNLIENNIDGDIEESIAKTLK